MYLDIQSLSIVVPTGECWNKCEYCVSRMHHEEYGKSIIQKHEGLQRSYISRMEFVREEGCNSMILTGTAEPQQNLPFIHMLLQYNKMLRNPFYNISIQTTGSGLTGKDITDLAENGLTTLALSLSSFSGERHWEITNTPKNKRIMTIPALIECAKENNLNVRVCFNLTNEFNAYYPEYYFNWCQKHEVDQATFRKIYADGCGEEAKWVRSHAFADCNFQDIVKYVKEEGIPIARLPYGFIQYSVNGISTVIDDNCMSKDTIDEMKYAILRPNGHLYSRWDDKGSLIF
jgi:molybdenum cofactor biosynthesis enzyme MoaA